MAHVLLHMSKAISQTQNRLRGNLREVEAEAVALLGCEAPKLGRADYARGYIQKLVAEEAVAAPTQFPKRAHRRFSAPRIKSSAQDKPSKEGAPDTRTRTCQEKARRVHTAALTHPNTPNITTALQRCSQRSQSRLGRWSDTIMT